jgi:hypothetical protein
MTGILLKMALNTINPVSNKILIYYTGVSTRFPYQIRVDFYHDPFNKKEGRNQDSPESPTFPV